MERESSCISEYFRIEFISTEPAIYRGWLMNLPN